MDGRRDRGEVDISRPGDFPAALGHMWDRSGSHTSCTSATPKLPLSSSTDLYRGICL